MKNRYREVIMAFGNCWNKLLVLREIMMGNKNKFEIVSPYFSVGPRTFQTTLVAFLIVLRCIIFHFFRSSTHSAIPRKANDISFIVNSFVSNCVSSDASASVFAHNIFF